MAEVATHEPLEASVYSLILQFHAVTYFLESDSIENAEVADLIVNYFILHEQRLLRAIRLDAAYEMQITFPQQLFHQTVHFMTKFERKELAHFVIRLFRVRRIISLFEEGSQRWQGGRTHGSFDLLSQKVFVFLSEANNRVLDVLRRVFDKESGRRQVEVARGETRMFLMFMSKFCDED